MTAASTVKLPDSTRREGAVTAPQSEKPPEAPPKRRRRRPLKLLAVLIFLGLGGAAWYAVSQTPTEEDAQLVLQGNIDVRQVNLAFKVEGRIETLAVDEGDEARAGQVIATLDKRYFADELRLARARSDNAAANLARLVHGSRPEEIAQARADLGQREATLDLARANLKRGEELAPGGAISKEELDQRRQAVQVGEANVNYAKAALRLAEIGPRQEDIDAARAMLGQQEAMLVQSERRLTDAELAAPADGIILTRARERGAIVQPGETVFTLTLARPVWVRTYVNERDLGLIRPDMPAQVTTDSDPGRAYPARVGFISPTAEFTPKTVETRELRTNLVYRLRVLVDKPDGGLRQGMPVTVAFDLHRKRTRTLWERLGGLIHWPGAGAEQ
jgi:HlyD family secretion protein